MARIRTAALLLTLALLAVGCGDRSAIGIIGGADGPTSIIVGKGENPTSPESPPAVSDSGSSSAAQSQSQPPSSDSASSISSASSASAPSSSVQAPAPSTAPASSDPTPPASSTVQEPPRYVKGFAFTEDEIRAGNMTILEVEGYPAKELSISADFGGSFKFFEVDSMAKALIGVSRNVAPGVYNVKVNSGGSTLATLQLNVLDGNFQTQSFQMEESVQNSTVNNTAARDEYNKMIARVTSTDTADSNWPDPYTGFIMPIRQETFKISSAYGYTRIVNGKVSGRHEGVDFPAPAGTPVTAAGSGKVIFSGMVQMTGNTVVIEHGMGLKTWYCHMRTLECEEGDWLEPGDAVGRVGTTGYSTGNHLHFGMSINDIYTNPWQFVPYPG